MSGKKTDPTRQTRRVTVRGVTLNVDPDVFDDLNMLEDLYAIQHAGDDAQGVFSVVPMLRRLAGGQYEQVKESLTDPETGRIPLESVAEWIGELMEKTSPNS